MNKHELEMQITKLLIESGLSLTKQLQAIEEIKNKIKFCKASGIEMQQYKLEL